MSGTIREILVLSGKGGTGKTSLAASFAALARKTVFCDADVEAPNLAILLEPDESRCEDFHGLPVYRIDEGKCTRCGRCEAACRFHAIQDCRIFPESCEGCGVCAIVCRDDAVVREERVTGRILRSSTRLGTLVHGNILPGAGNSGKLVSRLKEIAREQARSHGAGAILTDGPPGIGCPVIAALGGVDYVLAVTEPTPSGLHDLERLLDLVAHFGIPAGVVVNKSDLKPELSHRIRETALRRGRDDLGEIPFDPSVPGDIAKGRIPSETGSPFGRRAENIFHEVLRRGADMGRRGRHGE